MIKALVLYEREVDPERYARHVELCEQVPAAAFRHGKVFGAPSGEPPHAYVAEFEWPDRESFKAALVSPEFAATGRDAMDMGVPYRVEFVDLG